MILSICIPVRNRVNHVEKTIRNVRNVFRDYLGRDVEVCIVDGASNDGTREILANYQNFNGFQMLFKKVNGGVDLDYRECIKLASGKYIWLFSSDDEILIDGAQILSFLEHEKTLGLMILNRVEVNDSDKKIPVDQSDGVRFEALADNYTMAAYMSSFNGIYWRFSFAPSLLFSRELYLTNEPGAELFMGTCYAHVFVLCNCLEEVGSIWVSNIPIVKCLIGNDSFSSGGFAERLLIDLRAYSKFSDFFYANGDFETSSWLRQGIRQEHHFLRLVRSFLSIKKFVQIREYQLYINFFEFNHSSILLKILGLLKLIRFSRER